MTERPLSALSRAATAVSTVAMFVLLYLALFQHSTTNALVWTVLLSIWIAPVAVIVVVERKRRQ